MMSATASAAEKGNEVPLDKFKDVAHFSGLMGVVATLKEVLHHQVAQHLKSSWSK